MDVPFDRRAFLKTAAGTLALPVSRQGLASAQAPAVAPLTDPAVRFGLVGLGTWGREILDALGRTEAAQVTGICDVYEPFLKRAGTAAPKAEAVTDWLEDVIRGTKANLTMGGNRLQVAPERPFVDEIDARDETPPDAGEPHVKHMRNFLESIRADARPNCSDDLGIRVQTVVSMAELAFRKGRQVRFDERKREMIV